MTSSWFETRPAKRAKHGTILIMKINHKIVLDNIHLLIFESQLEITSTFLRFQEYYESPKFKNKIFSLEEFKDWYIKDSPNGKKTGKFTYYTDWSGFNIPNWVLKPFYDGKFDPLSTSEKKILKLFKDAIGPFYIIAVYNESKNLKKILKHEIAHGLFSTNNEYRSEILSILSNFDIEPIKNELRLMSGYNESVLIDEVHAFCIDSNPSFKMRIPKELSARLSEIYDRYVGDLEDLIK